MTSRFITLCYELSQVHGVPPRRRGRGTAKAGDWASRKIGWNEVLTQPSDGDRFWHVPPAPAEHFGGAGCRASFSVVDHQFRKGSRRTRTRVPERMKHSSGICRKARRF